MKLELCLLPVLLLLSNIFYATPAGRNETFKCVDGKSYFQNTCKLCVCHQGKLKCKNEKCNDKVETMYRDCKLGATWKVGCNRCWCVPGQGTICTEKCEHAPVHLNSHSTTKHPYRRD